MPLDNEFGRNSCVPGLAGLQLYCPVSKPLASSLVAVSSTAQRGPSQSNSMHLLFCGETWQ